VATAAVAVVVVVAGANTAGNQVINLAAFH